MRAKDGVGRYGEDVAARYLEQAGYELLARNWRCLQGELDIVARDGTTLVVCEVKTRSSDRFGSPAEAVDARKLGRLRRLTGQWLSESGLHPANVRIDVIAVVRPARGAALVEHLCGVG